MNGISPNFGMYTFYNRGLKKAHQEEPTTQPQPLPQPVETTEPSFKGKRVRITPEMRGIIIGTSGLGAMKVATATPEEPKRFKDEDINLDIDKEIKKMKDAIHRSYTDPDSLTEEERIYISNLEDLLGEIDSEKA